MAERHETVVAVEAPRRRKPPVDPTAGRDSIVVIKHTKVGEIDLFAHGERHWLDAFAEMAMADARDAMTDDSATTAVYEAGDVTINIAHRPKS